MSPRTWRIANRTVAALIVLAVAFDVAIVYRPNEVHELLTTCEPIVLQEECKGQKKGTKIGRVCAPIFDKRISTVESYPDQFVAADAVGKMECKAASL